MIERKCQGCKELKNRDLMLKITKLKDNTLKLNPNSKELGRSLYICKNKSCITTTIKKKRIQSALKYNNSKEILKIETELANFIVEYL